MDKKTKTNLNTEITILEKIQEKIQENIRIRTSNKNEVLIKFISMHPNSKNYLHNETDLSKITNQILNLAASADITENPSNNELLMLMFFRYLHEFKKDTNLQIPHIASLITTYNINGQKIEDENYILYINKSEYSKKAGSSLINLEKDALIIDPRADKIQTLNDILNNSELKELYIENVLVKDVELNYKDIITADIEQYKEFISEQIVKKLDNTSWPVYMNKFVYIEQDIDGTNYSYYIVAPEDNNNEYIKYNKLITIEECIHTLSIFLIDSINNDNQIKINMYKEIIDIFISKVTKKSAKTCFDSINKLLTYSINRRDITYTELYKEILGVFIIKLSNLPLPRIINESLDILSNITLDNQDFIKKICNKSLSLFIDNQLKLSFEGQLINLANILKDHIKTNPHLNSCALKDIFNIFAIKYLKHYPEKCLMEIIQILHDGEQLPELNNLHKDIQDIFESLVIKYLQLPNNHSPRISLNSNDSIIHKNKIDNILVNEPNNTKSIVYFKCAQICYKVDMIDSAKTFIGCADNRDLPENYKEQISFLREFLRPNSLKSITISPSGRPLKSPNKELDYHHNSGRSMNNLTLNS